MSLEGTVKSFNPAKGFGFILYEEQDVFLHVRDVQGGVPQAGDVVNFDTEPSDKNPGQLKALNVTGGTGTADGGKGAGGKGGAPLGVLGDGAYQAVVKSFSDMHGWGFIEYEGQDVFLHIRDCKGSKPRKGDTVAFDMEPSPMKEGSMKALNVTGGTAPFEEKGKGKGKDKGKDMGYGSYGAMAGGGKGKDAYSPYGGKGADMWGGAGAWGAPAWGADPWGGMGGKDPWGGKGAWGGKGGDPWGGKGGDAWGKGAGLSVW